MHMVASLQTDIFHFTSSNHSLYTDNYFNGNIFNILLFLGTDSKSSKMDAVDILYVCAALVCWPLFSVAALMHFWGIQPSGIG